MWTVNKKIKFFNIFIPIISVLDAIVLARMVLLPFRELADDTTLKSYPHIASQKRPATSPSGKYIAFVDNKMKPDMNYYQIRIVDNNTKKDMYIDSEQYCDIHYLMVTWDDQLDILWINSSDTGGKELNLSPDGEWTEMELNEINKYKPPQIIRDYYKDVDVAPAYEWIKGK